MTSSSPPHRRVTWMHDTAVSVPLRSSSSTTWRDQSGAAPETALPPTPTLDEFGRDLTALAQRGDLKEIIGRDETILQVARALLRREKSNPLLIGPPGVGKTAIVEALAQRLCCHTVHPQLQSVRVVDVSIPSLVAGTSYRGSMEERVLAILAELRSRRDIVVFFDEFHLIVGTGMVGGSRLDLANMFKPALVRGDLRCIGATTPAEYERAIRHDLALERRMLPIRVGEPSQDEMLAMMTRVAPAYQDFYNVEIDPGALVAAVALSVQYLPDRQLPDKAFDLLDDACTRVVLPALDGDGGQARVVTSEVIATVLAERTGIPLTHLTTRDRHIVPDIETQLALEVVGQPAAIEAVSTAVRVAAAGLRPLDRPRGVFLFGGPSGVGKTALARALARSLFGDEQSLLRIDLSEYQERHAVSRLVGAPPGYVGYDEGGQLTHHLRRSPYSVVLLDEVEKAHPLVLDLFLQIFDAGRITDAQGRAADARHAYFVLTTNLPMVDDRRALQQYFRPEFLNRIDRVVLFDPLSSEHLSLIARKQLEALNLQLGDQRSPVRIVADESAIDCLCQPDTQGEHPNGRSVIRRFERDVVAALADHLDADVQSPLTLSTRTDADGECLIVVGRDEAHPSPAA